jgi:RNA polymerase sigma-70 factor, ECF subfamily
MLGGRDRGAPLALVTEDTSPPAPPSFDEVYAQHAGYVAGLAGRILGRNDDVPDAVQDVFLIAHRHLRELRDSRAVKAWLGRITVREASRRLRWRRLWSLVVPAAPVDTDLIADDREAAGARPLVALLYTALDRVPVAARAAWVLRYLMDEPLDSVAEMCGCSLATAKRRIGAAEDLLRPLLGPEETRNA